jgi:hypothetical protein
MDRRQFFAAGITAGLLCVCGRVGPANSQASTHGCRMAAGDARTFGYKLAARSGASAEIDEFVQKASRHLGDALGVRPAVFFWDDKGAANALATPAATSPDGPDGTVLLGTTLVKEEIRRPSDKRLDHPLIKEALKDVPRGHLASIYLILAHEFAHILQYKKGYTPTGPWQMEPHADYMAGWVARKWTYSRRTTEPPEFPGFTMGDLVWTLATIYEKGDRLFNDPAHHGAPESRIAMVHAGMNSRNLDLGAAFEQGKVMAKLL